MPEDLYKKFLQNLILSAHNDDNDDSDGDNETKHDYSVTVEEKTKTPRMYKVLLHNDDYTTMEFVVMVLKNVFQKSEVEASEIMLKVHKDGVGVCGIYTKEISESKAMKVTQLAREHGHPLKCTITPE